MKLLLVTFSDNADHQDTLFGMYEQMQSRYDVTLLTIQTPKVPLRQGAHTWLVDCPKRPGICKKTFHLSLLMRLIRQISSEKFDVIWFESLHIWNLPIQIFCKKRSKIYQVIHEVIPHCGDRQTTMVDRMNKAVCRTADIIVLHNKKDIQTMLERYQISANRVKYLELWRRYPAYSPHSRSGRILFFGRINPYKGADNLLKIVRLCPEISFDVVGRADPQMAAIVQQLQKEKNVTLKAEYVSDEEMQRAFRQADWVVLPYNSASQSGVIIDAYRYSRPVIAFDVGAIAEQVEHQKSGYLVPAGDREAFAKQLRDAAAMSAEKYEQMMHFAYEFGSRKYAVAGAVGRFCDLIDCRG